MSVLRDFAPEWHQDAPCRLLTKLFFSEKPAEVRRAKEICMSCSVRLQCRAEADELETSANTVFGVRAGMDAKARKKMRKQPARGGRTRNTA